MNFFEQKINEQIEKDINRRQRKGYEPRKKSEGHTLGDFIGAVMKIDNKQDAALFYRGYLEWLSGVPKKDKSKDLADEQIAKSNIGWCFGEGMDPKMIEMWNKVTGASHPVFGTGIPTPEEAIQAGMKLASRKRK